LETQPFSETAKAEKKKDAAIIGAGTGIGAAIGAIAGGGKGAAIGAIAGGGSSSGYVLATKGKQLKYPSETLMTFKLAEPLTVTR
jgi:glucokinase